MLKQLTIPESCFPDIHRINLFQIGICLSPDKNHAPYSIKELPWYFEKITKGLSLALKNDWANIVVFPEVSISRNILIELMNKASDIVKARHKDAGAAVICLPMEHLSWDDFNKLNISLFSSGFKYGDNNQSIESLSVNLFKTIAPNDYMDAFVNIAILLVFNQSGPEAKGFYFIQPKLCPYSGENETKGGIFIRGNVSYLLEIGGVKILTVICYDMIAQDLENKEPIVHGLIKECLKQKQGLDYLLVPQCNDEPTNPNFQSALFHINSVFQNDSQLFRILAPNIANLKINEKVTDFGHSWIVTNSFYKELPEIGLLEQNLPTNPKDPYSGKEIKATLPLANAKRLRLAAPGEWMLHLEFPKAKLLRDIGKNPTIPISAHKGKIYKWNNSECIWKEKDSDEFTHECYAYEYQDLIKLSELSNWIKENLGGKNTYSPAYEEFEKRVIQLPFQEKTSVLSSLEKGNDIWVRGAPASGKTVFGLGIAFDWNARLSVFFDLATLNGDKDPHIENVKNEIEYLCIRGHELLLVLDNIHTWESLANSLLLYVQRLRKSGYQIQALLLGRRRENQLTERNSLADNNNLVPVDLKANEEAFRCVAIRLLKKINSDYEMKPEIVCKWVKECGGDLVVFAVAFSPSNPESLDRESISKYVHKRYIIPAEKQLGGKDKFMDLCAMSAIDLDIEDRAVWKESAENIYPDFIENGIIIRNTKGRNPRQCCKLFHPSLGELILKVNENFSEQDFEKIWLSQAIKICLKHPLMLSFIHYRLYTGEYNNIADFNKWCVAIENSDDLVERALCSLPNWACNALKKGNIKWSWKRLLDLPLDQGYNLLINQLAQTSVGELPIFFNYLKMFEPSAQWKTLLSNLLNNDGFKNRLHMNPVDSLIIFFRYLDKNRFTEQRKILLSILLKEKYNEFNNRLVQAPAGHLASFFSCYPKEHEFKKQRKTLLSSILEDDGFKNRLASNSVSSLAGFFCCLDKYGFTEQRETLLLSLLKDNKDFEDGLVRAKADDFTAFLNYLDDCKLVNKRTILLDNLFSNDDFIKRNLSDASLSAQGTLWNYLAIKYNKKITQDLFDKNWKLLSTEDIKRKISAEPRENIHGFQRKIIDAGLNLPQPLWGILIQIAVESSYESLIPDPEYPQNRLFVMSICELTELLKSFKRISERHKMNCIVKSLISDESQFCKWFNLLSLKDALLIRDTFKELSIPPFNDFWVKRH